MFIYCIYTDYTPYTAAYMYYYEHLVLPRKLRFVH